MRSRLHVVAALALAALLPFAPAHAQNFPRKPVKIIVPFPPGGTPDMLSRLLAQRATQILGQQVIVDNRPGAGGNVAMDLVSRAPADGHTLIMGTVSTCSVNEFIFKGLTYNVERDFAPLMEVGRISNLLAVHPSLPVNSVKDLVALAKAKPGTLTYATSGYATTLHLTAELFESSAGIQIRHVPYKGSALAVTALVAGEVSFMFDNMPTIAQQAAAGKVRPLAVTGPKRSKLFPNVPTMQEAGYQDLVVQPWFGLLAPAKVPPAVLAKLNAVFNEAMRDPTVLKRFSEIDLQPVGGSGADFQKLIRAEAQKWGRLVREKNITAE